MALVLAVTASGSFVGKSDNPMRRVMPRILLVDDHLLYRKALRGALESLIPKTQVLEADNLEVAREQLDPDGHLDLVLVDLATPYVSSLEILRSVHECYPKTRFAATAALATRVDIVRCLEAGLYGLISKSQPDDEILSAINDVLADRIYVPLSLTHVDVKTVRASDAGGYDTAPPQISTEARVDKLTRRQREVLPLLARGMSNKEIARALKIAEGTTKIHASSVLRVLGVRNRTEVAAVAQNLLRAADNQPTSRNGKGPEPPSHF
jgi:DNA-binding NarL/FixJ family response regulator